MARITQRLKTTSTKIPYSNSGVHGLERRVEFIPNGRVHQRRQKQHQHPVNRFVTQMPDLFVVILR